MKKTVSIPGVVLLAWSFVAPAVAGTFPTFCGIMPYVRDNLTVKADVPDGKLRIGQEGSFRVYLYNTMTIPFSDASLGVFSEQFDARVTPSPTWKTFPDIPTVAESGTPQYFTVTLNRKSGVPDGQYDIMLRVYSSRVTYRRLATSAPLTEALDLHAVPTPAAIAVDGLASPSEWADSLPIKGFLAYKLDGRAFKSRAPAAQTRVHLAADPENLYLLVLFMDVGPGDDLKIYVAPDLESKPKVVTLDATTGKAAADFPLDGMQCMRCKDDSLGDRAALYEMRIPRKALGVNAGNEFFADFSRSAHPTAGDPKPEYSYWRGNDVSVNAPVVYGRMAVATAGKVAGTPVATGPAVGDSDGTTADRDNFFMKADLPAADLLSADKKSFRVYVRSTMNAGLTNIALQVLSDRFAATVAPSPTWTTYPDLTSGARNWFMVTLKAKTPASGTASDVFLKLTSSPGQTHQLLAFQPLADAIDERLLPLGPAVAVDGKVSPSEWGNAVALTGFQPYKKDGDHWRGGTPAPTRVQLAADHDNLYLLVTFMAVSKNGTLKLQFATDPEAAPAWVALDRATGSITSSVSTNGMLSVKCDDDPILHISPNDPYKVPSSTVYECRIPRKSLGIGAAQGFLANAEASGAYWRGNPDSAADPVTYGRFSLGR